MKGRFFDGYGKPAWVPLAVAAIIQWRAALAGPEGDFAGHSLRSGFVTEGGRQGIALPALMTMTEHRSVASDVGYFQTGSASTNPAAHLLTRAGRGCHAFDAAANLWFMDQPLQSGPRFR